MGTVTKALRLLEHFSAARPRIGLSELARLSGRDKATVRRLLAELAGNGFVEQEPDSRAYRLGPALLRLANVREATTPLRRAARPALDRLGACTSETVHLSALDGGALSTVAHVDAPHGTRVHIDEAEKLPLHATASGLVVLAFGETELLERVAAGPLPRLGPGCVGDAEALRRRVATARAAGLAEASDSFEEGVAGTAAPLFDSSGRCMGAVAVARPVFRDSPEAAARIRDATRDAAEEITKALGGTPPAALMRAWAA